MINQIADILTTLAVLLPIVIQLVKLIGQKTHNQRLVNLSDRATIIVTALEQSQLDGPAKKQEAMTRLSQYAGEVGIKVTSQQLSDYIESSVNALKQLNQ